MTTLKEAQKDPKKLDQFIKDHENDAAGDKDRFNAALDAIAGKPKVTQAAPSQDGGES